MANINTNNKNGSFNAALPPAAEASKNAPTSTSPATTSTTPAATTEIPQSSPDVAKNSAPTQSAANATPANIPTSENSGFDFSQIGKNNPNPDINKTPVESPKTPVDTTSRADELNKAFAATMDQAKNGNPEPLKQAVVAQVAQAESLAQEVAEPASQRGKEGKESGPEVDGQRADVYKNVAEHQKNQKALLTRLSTEAQLAEKAGNKELAAFYKNQYTTVKTSHDQLERTLQNHDAQKEFAHTKEQASKFNQLTGNNSKGQKLTPEQQKAQAKLAQSDKAFKAGDAAAGRVKNKPDVPKAAVSQLAQSATKSKSPAGELTTKTGKPQEVEIDEGQEVQNEGVESAEEKVKAPTQDAVAVAQSMVAAKVDKNTREERTASFKNQRDKIALAKNILKADQDLPQESAQKSLAKGAENLYRNTHALAFKDTLGGNHGENSLAGVIYFGGEGQSMAALANKNSSGVLGQNTLASLVGSESVELKPEEAPAKLAALGRNGKEPFESTVFNLFSNWTPRSQRASRVSDMLVDGISTGHVPA